MENTMKLSEAIRLGAMLRPQAYGTYFSFSLSASCAIGAALEARYGLETAKKVIEVEATLPWPDLDLERVVECPAINGGLMGPCLQMSNAMGSLIAHLNDVHRWTRERIADWVEEQEKLQAQAKESAKAEIRQTESIEAIEGVLAGA